MNSSETIARRENLSSEEFFEGYVKKGLPVVVPGALKECPALSRWSLDYLRTHTGNQTVCLKEWYASELQVSRIRLSHYLDSIEEYESRSRRGAASAAERPAYLHDMPLVYVLPDAVADLTPFPKEYFPAWYRYDWWKFAQSLCSLMAMAFRSAKCRACSRA